MSISPVDAPPQLTLQPLPESVFEGNTWGIALEGSSEDEEAIKDLEEADYRIGDKSLWKCP